MALPTFLIIGVHRAGTTALWEWLRHHPDVFMARPKEVHFFDRDFEKGLGWYEEKFSSAPEGAVCGEATPAYIYEPTALARMAEVLPEAKLVVSLRNPIDQAYSEYWHRRSEKREARGFTEAYPDFLHTGAYLPQLLSVSEFYPREALKVVFFEDLLGAYRDTCHFIGVRDIAPPHPEQSVNAYSRIRSQQVQRISSWLKARSLRGIADVLRRVNTSQTRYPPMDPSVRARLATQVDTAALQSWLGHDLPWD